MRRRLMLAFAAFTLFVAVLFSAMAVLFLYAVEDRFFSDALQHEAQTQIAHHEQFGDWAAPRSDFMAIHADPKTFPDDLRERYLADPTRSEFAGTDGRHYHLLRLRPDGSAEPIAFLVAEVNQQLVVRRMRGGIMELLAWSVSLVVATALVLGFWLARRMSAPLSELARRVEAMRPDDPPLDAGKGSRTREVDILATGLVSLTTRISEFVEREREFTRDVSHELRTSLAVIHSGCERLEADRDLSAAARRQIGFIRQSSWQLQQCVATLLSLAREEGQPDSPQLPIAVLPVIEQVVLEQGLLLEGKPVEVVVAVDPGARMQLSTAVLHILLGNLVGNAFSHTVKGEVRIDCDGGRLRIANSQPMQEAATGDLFQPYAKGEASAGFGLGLAIVRRLCDRYRIDLRIESGPEGTCASLALDNASD